MICIDIWHKYHEWYFEICDKFEISRVIFMPNITYKSCYYLFILLPARFVIFTCRYFKLSWNTTALSQSNCRNFSCSSINTLISMVKEKTLSFHRNGVEGVETCNSRSMLVIMQVPGTISGNPRCRINNKLARESCFFCDNFFAVTARLHFVKLPSFTFSGRRKHKTTTFYFFFWIQPLEFNSRKIC